MAISDARSQLETAVSDLRSLSQEDVPDAAAVSDAAQRVLQAAEEAAESWAGECQEGGAPYARIFLVFHDNGKYWRCTHKPPRGPHEFPA
jgi:hypothetical protein